MRITSAQRNFVSVLVETGSYRRAATLAGIDETETDSAPVQRALKDALGVRLMRSAPSALIVMERLATDETIPPAVRRLAAADILDRAGLVSQAALQLSKPLESLSEMPADNLRALVQRLESELFSRATPIDAPLIEHDPSKPLSVLD